MNVSQLEAVHRQLAGIATYVRSGHFPSSGGWPNWLVPSQVQAHKPQLGTSLTRRWLNSTQLRDCPDGHGTIESPLLEELHLSRLSPFHLLLFPDLRSLPFASRRRSPSRYSLSLLAPHSLSAGVLRSITWSGCALFHPNFTRVYQFLLVKGKIFRVSLFIGSKVPSFYPFPDLLTDEKYYGAEVITCKDGSGSFTRDRLNDNFCDCFDGTDEPGNLPITFTIFHFITEIWMACIYFLYCSVSTPGSFPTSMESLSWLWMS